MLKLQVRHQNENMKIFFRRLPLSRFLSKTYRSAHAKLFYGCFRHKTWGSEDFTKIATFWAKTTSHGHRSWVIDMILKPKLNHSNGSLQKSQDRKKQFKFDKMWRIFLLFSSIAMAWCIMNSYHKVVRSIGNTILKLFADCAKQLARNAQKNQS